MAPAIVDGHSEWLSTGESVHEIEVDDCMCNGKENRISENIKTSKTLFTLTPSCLHDKRVGLRN